MKIKIVSIDQLDIVRHASGEVVAVEYEIVGRDEYGSYVNRVPVSLGQRLYVGREFDFINNDDLNEMLEPMRD